MYSSMFLLFALSPTQPVIEFFFSSFHRIVDTTSNHYMEKTQQQLTLEMVYFHDFC